MIQAIKTDMMATNKTAAALISLITLISGLMSILTKSQKCSITVLKNSEAITIPIQSMIEIHSKLFNLKTIPKQRTHKAMMTCILKLISDIHIAFNPAKA